MEKETDTMTSLGVGEGHSHCSSCWRGEEGTPALELEEEGRDKTPPPHPQLRPPTATSIRQKAKLLPI